MIREKPHYQLPPKLGLDLRSDGRQKFTSHPTVLKISRLEFKLAKLRKGSSSTDTTLRWLYNSTANYFPDR